MKDNNPPPHRFLVQGLVPTSRAADFQHECHQLIAIFTTIAKKTKEGLKEGTTAEG